MSLTNKAVDKSTSVLFNAYLRPNRSLSSFGFKILMVSIIAVLFLCGLGFSLFGAWPVFGFLGLDFLLVYFAFRLNYQSGGRYEHIRVTTDELRVTKISHKGQKQITMFHPYWLRISLEKRSEDENSLMITSHGRSVSIGSFLAPEERCRLADELNQVLKTLK